MMIDNNISYGLLEIICPFTLWYLTPEKACSDPRFYCHLVIGKPELKRDHLSVIGLGRIKVVLSSIFFKKRLVTLHLILAVLYLPPLVLKFEILFRNFSVRFV